MADLRPDDPSGVAKFQGKHKGQKALIVLGGYSGEKWKELKQELNPDIILIANGVNAMIPDADYWLCAENMTRATRLGNEGDKRQKQFADILNRVGPKVRFVSHRSWNLLKDKKGAVKIRRKSYDLPEIPENFSIREYGEGLWGGWFLKHKEAGATVMVGTVALHLLHLAGILGCAEVHTIGFDLMFRKNDQHHWYPYPIYKPDRFRNEKMFVNHLGADTQHFWVETAEYMIAIEDRFTKDGMTWKDHSDGLLKIMGAKCAQ